MTAAGSKILTGAREALAIARGKADAARVMQHGEDGLMHGITTEWNAESRSAVRPSAAEKRALCEGAEARHRAIIDRWLADPAFKASLRANHHRSNTRIPHRAGSAGTETNFEASTPAASPRTAEES